VRSASLKTFFYYFSCLSFPCGSTFLEVRTHAFDTFKRTNTRQRNKEARSISSNICAESHKGAGSAIQKTGSEHCGA
jgi:hypothetical protein